MSNNFQLNRSLYFWSIFVVAVMNTVILNAQRMNGMSFSGPRDSTLTLEMFESIKISNANWVALIPQGKLDRNTLMILPDEGNDWWCNTIEANTKGIRLAKQAGLKVFVKPHVVLSKLEEVVTDKTRGAEWRGDLSLRKEKDWRILELSYEKYVLKLAKIAQEEKVDLFSVGTELKKFAMQRPDFWKQLIQKVKNVYNGPLTYAANWDEYHKITFWEDLDYIGVDTYFPVNRTKTPDVKKTIKNWKSIQKELKQLSKAENRQILLTEFGYRNVSYAGRRPWTHDKGEDIPTNNQTQVNLYQAFFETFWEKDWVAGGFSWKWFAHPKSGKDTSFSVQGKPALAVLQKWYAQPK